MATKQGLAIFDFDGTIADTMGELTIKATQLLSGPGLKLSHEKARELYLTTSGIPFPEQFDTIHPDAPGRIRSRVLDAFEQYKLSTLASAQPVTGMPTSLATLRELHWDIVIISSTDRELVEWWSRRHQIDDVVDKIHGIDFIYETKDELLDNVLGRPRRLPTVFIGDSVSDYVRARDRNIDFIGVSGIVASEFMWRSLGVPCATGIKYMSDLVKEIYVEDE